MISWKALSKIQENIGCEFFHKYSFRMEYFPKELNDSINIDKWGNNVSVSKYSMSLAFSKIHVNIQKLIFILFFFTVKQYIEEFTDFESSYGKHFPKFRWIFDVQVFQKYSFRIKYFLEESIWISMNKEQMTQFSNIPWRNFHLGLSIIQYARAYSK